VAGCPDCALLVSDLRAIADATATLPVPPRRRDFRLSPEAARQARGWRPRRFFDRIGIVPSLGAGLAAIGLAGLLLASIPGSGATSFGGVTTESVPRTAAGAAAPAGVAAPASSARATTAPVPDLAAPGGPIATASAAPSTGSVTPSAAPSARPSSEAIHPPVGPSPPAPAVAPSVPGAVNGTPGGLSALGIASLGALVVGVVVLVLGIVRRRRSPD